MLRLISCYYLPIRMVFDNQVVTSPLTIVKRYMMQDRIFIRIHLFTFLVALLIRCRTTLKLNDCI